jgi:hypothetical protein
MKITLQRTGGMLPLKKQSTCEVPWTEEEVEHLLKKIKRDNSNAGSSRDATGYSVIVNEHTTAIDMDTVPSKYKKIFDDLVDRLEIVK